MAPTATGVTITEQAAAGMQRVCEDFLKHSRARCALLVGRDGALLSQHGFTEDLDGQVAAALASACYASTEALAQLVGEPRFNMFYQQGATHHLQIHVVGESALLVVAFDDRTNAGLVRLSAQTTARRLARLLAPSETTFPR
jgi:predicted regulator of Ras-like GTPase activity (Roadblock/LC7/MglB family)